MRDNLFRRARYAFGVAALASLVLAGCSPAGNNSENPSGAENLATFDGGKVTRAQFDEQAKSLLQQSAAQQGGQQGGQEPKIPAEDDPQYDQLVTQVMPQLVSIEIAGAYAEENGITVSDKEVDAEVQRLKEQIGQQAQASGQDVGEDEAFRQALEQAGFTEQDLRSDIREQLPVQKVQEEVAKDARPSGEEVRRFYDENKASFAEPETRCASHILFSPDQKNRAEEAKREIEGGGDFAKLAREESQDPGTAEKGGDLGCQPETDPQTGEQTYAPAFNDALFKAKEGDLAGPVKTEFGYHLIDVREVRKESTPPLEEVEGEIRDQLTQQTQSAEFERWVQDQEKSRNVQYREGYDPEKVGGGGETTGGGAVPPPG